MITANPLPEQLWAVLYAAIAGAACGVLYDIFREIRWSCAHCWLELLLDVLFSIVAASVLFVLVTGVAQLRLRAFIPASMAAGWLLWNFTLGRIFRWLLRKLRYILARVMDIPHKWCAAIVSHRHFRRKSKKKQRQISEKSRKKEKKSFHFCLRWYKIK